MLQDQNLETFIHKEAEFYGKSYDTIKKELHPNFNVQLLGGHPQIQINLGHSVIEVDIKLAPLLERINRHGLFTNMSCQYTRRGFASICFTLKSWEATLDFLKKERRKLFFSLIKAMQTNECFVIYDVPEHIVTWKFDPDKISEMVEEYDSILNTNDFQTMESNLPDMVITNDDLLTDEYVWISHESFLRFAEEHGINVPEDVLVDYEKATTLAEQINHLLFTGLFWFFTRERGNLIFNKHKLFVRWPEEKKWEKQANEKDQIWLSDFLIHIRR